MYRRSGKTIWMAAIAFLCALLGVAIGLGTFTFGYAEGHSYFSDDPKACMNCHVMREHYDSWQRSTHHAAANCNGCHVPHDDVGKLLSKAENGFWHSYYFTMQNFHEPIRISQKNARILQNNCIDCHKDLVGDILHVGSL